MGIGAAILQHDLHLCLAINGLHQAGIELLAQRQHLRAGLGDIQVHRVQPLDGGQRGVLAGGDQRAGSDAGGAATAVDRCGPPRVVKVDAGGLQRSARSDHIGLRLLQCRGRIIGILLAGRVHAHQRAGALGLRLRRQHAGLGLGQLAPRAAGRP
ncbi:hypothetical protein G6F61_014128 [Rhizopus arrhizus]|nr:hypothetical protein G6F61_014128 [Rhizopus arrhizus]